MRSKFDEQLLTLNKRMIAMGSLCETAISHAMTALLERDLNLARDVAASAFQIEQMEREIEALCLKLLMQQQPVARDLRVISSALKMITDMKRIGVQAANIAEIIVLDNITVLEGSTEIAEMARATIKMVKQSIDAFVNKDIDLANEVIGYDDIVDNYFDSVKGSLIALFGKPNTDGESTLDLLMIAKYLERIGDHAVNIAEWVVFSISGVHKEV